ncbi:MAG: M23 peptidase domain-containing protein [Parcubacteria group bacterium Greene0714_21]|nr:MAG: M23 peptidase domain-containing protein [Parcubacteria group bacterium Greene0416_39]TSC98365.1 MAG: M23 peptidase domain-containing protein [Parcubacteria group bacterium Greene1014_47]TSD04016.1 MAG: M23 peptidase domain-containing protein [Parcubacteria group bacterium Greene0714_21]
MKRSLTEDLGAKQGVHPLIFVALCAIFLFGMLSTRNVKQESSLALLAGVSAGVFPSQGQVSSSARLGPEAPELVMVGQTGILASTPPLSVTSKVLGAIVGQVDTDIHAEVFEYEVEQGNTPESLAKQFLISVNTILWANDLQETSTLKPGQSVLILPVSGTLHLVRPNDTLSEIASWYQADKESIIEFNRLDPLSGIFAGDFLIIPNGIMPKTLPQGRLTRLANSYFIWPIPAPHRITQGLHPFNAVDMANGMCGESVYAAASGMVQKTGYTYIGGNYVRILHSNGVVTYYGHLSATLVSPGAKVFQGQVVGYTGRTGRLATGCHLHFEVRGAANPFSQ